MEGAKKDREKFLNQPRKKKDTKIAWVSTYDPRVPSKTTIIKKNLHLLHANVVNKEILPPRTIIPADRKRKNIAQMYKPTVPQRYVQHGPMNRPVFFLAKKDATRVAIQKKPLFLYLRGTVDIGPYITCSSPNTVYVVMCEVNNKWYVGSTTDLKARWRNHKSDAKLKKATKRGVADHVTKFKHPEDPQLGFLIIVAAEAVKWKKRLDCPGKLLDVQAGHNLQGYEHKERT